MTVPATNGMGDLRGRARTAFLAAAYGDALGWPNESRGKLVLKKPKAPPSPTLISWSRRDGFRAQAHGETLEPGTYSDDTQMIASVARSLVISGDRDWWRRFTRVELPFWRLYQRGGGAALLRSAKAWADGKAPWQVAVDDYNRAGGNGVAMRILPHVVWHHADDYLTLHRSVVLDGIATHGHPRALIGGTLFAYVLWSMFRRSGPLSFGEMVETAIGGVDQWSASPNNYLERVKDWSPVAWTPPPDFRDVWDATRTEALDLLKIVQNAMSQGALFVDRPTLESLGALGPERGSGTISAVSAIFLASRYASDPSHGVVEAAYAMGGDTDTLASMTATLLATVLEGDTLAYRAQDVQDHDFLARLALQIVDKQSLVVRPLEPPEVVTSQRAAKWMIAIHKRAEGEPINLLDGRSGIVSSHRNRDERDLEILETTVKAEDGQTLRFKRVQKRAVAESRTMFEDLPAVRHEPPPRPDAYGPEIVLRCRNLDMTIRFYERALGLRIYEDRRQRSPQQVRIEGPLTFVQARGASEVSTQVGTEIRLRTRNAGELAAQIGRFGTQASLEERDGSRVVITIDPDGRTVMIFAKR